MMTPGSSNSRNAGRMLMALLCLAAWSGPGLAAGLCEPEVLGPDDADEVHERYASLIVTPSSVHRALVKKSFEMAPELLCHATERVVFVEHAGESGATMGWTMASAGDLIYISALPTTASVRNLLPEYLERTYATLSEDEITQLAAKNQAEVIQSILHEAAHAAHHLLDSQRDAGFMDSPPNAEAWDHDALAYAREVVDSHRLKAGLLDGEWVRLHQAFVEEGMAQEWSPQKGNLLARGFMSDYGATKPSDDIAEMTAWALVAGMYAPLEQGEPEDMACQAMRASGDDSIGGGNAAFYVKLALLEDLGFITREAFDHCTGSVRFTTATSKGFHVYNGSELRRTIGSGVKARIGKDTEFDRWVFTLDADGQGRFGDQTIPMHFALKLKLVDGAMASAFTDADEVSWPRGIYPLVRPNAPSSFWINAPDDRSATLWATKGLVLVIRASNERIEGSIVPQAFLRPFAPIPVPETPPTRITFVLSK